MPSLLAKEGPLSGQRLTVESAITLGRGEADVVIDDPEISRRHALVRACEGYFEIEDLDSLNGTWVNGSRIAESVRLEPGDVVRLGSTVLEVQTELGSLPPLPAEDRNLAFDPPSMPPLPSPTRLGSVDNGRCSECGAETPSFARFCSSCGVAFRSEQEQAPAPISPRAADERGRAFGGGG